MVVSLEHLLLQEEHLRPPLERLQLPPPALGAAPAFGAAPVDPGGLALEAVLAVATLRAKQRANHEIVVKSKQQPLGGVVSHEIAIPSASFRLSRVFVTASRMVAVCAVYLNESGSDNRD